MSPSLSRRVPLRVHEAALADWPSRRSHVRPAPIRSLCHTPDSLRAITRIACRDPGRGNARACFQGDSPQPTVAPYPPPRSSATLRNPKQGWFGAWRARIMRLPLSRCVLLFHFRDHRDRIVSLSFSPSFFLSGRCSHLLATGTGRAGHFTLAIFFPPYDLSG